MGNNTSASKRNPVDNAQLEQNSLRIAMWLNLFMGVAGICASFASHSDALLVDGLYSAVNFGAAIVAIMVGRSISRAPDRRRPFGYDADEAIYVVFRSLTLLGIISFAALSASEKIFTYLRGGSIPELIFGPIVIYMLAMVSICAFLAILHYRNWKKTNKQSEILLTEARAAVIDGVMSAGAGGVLVLVPFLEGTPLQGLIPIADALVVLILAAFIVYQPARSFLTGLSEIAGTSTSGTHYRMARNIADAVLKERDFTLIDLAATKLGRSHMIVAFANPNKKVSSVEIDDANEEFTRRAQENFSIVRTEIILTTRPRLKRSATKN